MMIADIVYHTACIGRALFILSKRGLSVFGDGPVSRLMYGHTVQVEYEKHTMILKSEGSH